MSIAMESLGHYPLKENGEMIFNYRIMLKLSHHAYHAANHCIYSSLPTYIICIIKSIAFCFCFYL